MPPENEEAKLTIAVSRCRSAMTDGRPYIVRCNDCEFVSHVVQDEQRALNERDFHSFDRLHSVSIWRYEKECWTMVTELMGVVLH